MIAIRLAGCNFDDVRRMADVMAHPDLTPLADELGEIMVEGNRRGLLAGTDIFGDQMADLEPKTKKTRGGDGPPLIPQFGGSRAIADFTYRVEELTDRLLVIGEWPNTHYIHFHSSGTANMVARDPVGVRPEDVQLMADAVERFAANLIARF